MGAAPCLSGEGLVVGGTGAGLADGPSGFTPGEQEQALLSQRTKHAETVSANAGIMISGQFSHAVEVVSS